MKRIIKLVVLSSVIVGIVTGCSNAKIETTESSESKTIVSELKKTKSTENFEVTIISAKIVENELNTDVGKRTVELDVRAKNITDEDQSIGTGDFVIVGEDGKEYAFTGNENNFGDAVSAKKTLEGKGYYSIPNDMNYGVIVYNPFQSTEQLKWETKFSPLDKK
ncbi:MULTISPECIES: DUF4352 domain-containing protein [unclassified Enterococcus]|uniref:DUF4352 domain-containing protein n=1 Tax=unclassified Enterococcus TaxID=2608891 RepID=UPI001CE204E5|nr:MULTISPECIES: DUF4352 domain-containing protein [unclassified Enterococcus]